MNCIVTAGPTYENLDKVRRLTNLSTGRLGSELAEFLVAQGHHVKLLLGEQATHGPRPSGPEPEIFTTTADLSDRLRQNSQGSVDALFHAAAVSDFMFGKVWARSADKQQLTDLAREKISTRHGTLLVELLPTPKIIASLRQWYPSAVLVGWKYEVEGTAADVIKLAHRQIAECHTTACVANGPAYGAGFGVITADARHRHVETNAELFASLAELLVRNAQ